jgi:hypothetical protein
MLLCDGNNGYLMDIEGVFHDFHGLMICGKKKKHRSCGFFGFEIIDDPYFHHKWFGTIIV